MAGVSNVADVAAICGVSPFGNVHGLGPSILKRSMERQRQIEGSLHYTKGRGQPTGASEHNSGRSSSIVAVVQRTGQCVFGMGPQAA